MEAKTCETCGEEFKRRGRSAARWATARYCSRLCYRRPREVKVCEVCTVEFERKSTSDERWAKRRFCSRECMGCGSRPEGEDSLERRRERHRATAVRVGRELRLEMLEAYGAECACCGEERPEFLTLEHKTGVPDHHRTATGKRLSGRALYRRVKKEGYPDAYEILCFNCNLARSIYGTCPHAVERDMTALRSRLCN